MKSVEQIRNAGRLQDKGKCEKCKREESDDPSNHTIFFLKKMQNIGFKKEIEKIGIMASSSSDSVL